MGGFCGAISSRDVVLDVYFGTDYHSHLGTRRGGMAAWDPELGFQREIHNIENAPFRTKFDRTVGEMVGKCCIGSISDTDPQPLLVRSVHGTYAICVVGVIKNEDQLIQQLLDQADGHFEAMSGGRVNSNELVATLISQRPTIAEGIRYAQEMVEGTVSVLIMTPTASSLAGINLAVCPFMWDRMTRAAVWPLSPLPTRRWATMTPMSWVRQKW